MLTEGFDRVAGKALASPSALSEMGSEGSMRVG
jgi:hypothetical protein